MTKITVKIDKEIIRKAMFCGWDTLLTSDNCAITLAIKDLFGRYAFTGHYAIHIESPNGKLLHTILLPTEAKSFIKTFDNLVDQPAMRLEMSELSFDIEIPNEVIDMISIDKAKAILKNHRNLQLVP